MVVPGGADDFHGQVGVLLRMLVGRQQCFPMEDVHIEMVGLLRKVAGQDGDQVADACVLGLTERVRRD